MVHYMQILIFAKLALLYLAACLRKSLSRQMEGQLIGEEFHERDKSTTANIFARIQSRRVALYRRLFNIRDENFASFYHNWRYDGGGPIIVLLAEENSECINCHTAANPAFFGSERVIICVIARLSLIESDDTV